MDMLLDRRTVLTGIGAGAVAAGFACSPGLARTLAAPDLTPFRTPYKYGKLVLTRSGIEGSFDAKAVDCPFVFFADGRFHMTYVGFDGTGYQTGLAQSDDLIHWDSRELILARTPGSPVTRYNIAMMCILRDSALTSQGKLKKVGGRYVGAWHAYPNPGYEAGPAVIGLAWSDDLHHWELTDPILTPDPKAAWEAGGLYKPYLVLDGDTYYLYYNAKNSDKRWIEQTGVATSKDLKTWVRHPGNPLLPVGPAGSWDERFASDPAVFRYGKRWVMYYYGLAANGKARELLALGSDPFHFGKAPEIMIDTGPAGSVDEVYAHKPTVIMHDGALYHFYCAVSGKWPNETRGISVACSKPW